VKWLSLSVTPLCTTLCCKLAFWSQDLLESPVRWDCVTVTWPLCHAVMCWVEKGWVMHHSSKEACVCVNDDSLWFAAAIVRNCWSGTAPFCQQCGPSQLRPIITNRTMICTDVVRGVMSNAMQPCCFATIGRISDSFSQNTCWSCENAFLVSRQPQQHAGVSKSTNHKQPVQLGPCTTVKRDQPLQA